MSLIARYVLSEIIQLFLLIVVALTMILLLCGIGKEALEHGLGFGPIMRLIPYLLPKALLFAVPATVLFAVTNVFGRMSSAGEIVALKAAGISPTGILAPVGALAVMLSLLTFWLNDVSFSWGEQGIKRVVIDAFEEIAYSVLRTQRSFKSDQFSVNVRRVEGRQLIAPTFTFQSDGNSPPTIVRAAEAELKSNPGTGVLTVTCRDGSVEMGTTSFDFPDTFEREMPLFDPNKDPLAGESPSRIPLRLIPDRTVKQVALVERLEQRAAAATATALMTGDYERLVNGENYHRMAALEQAHSDLFRLRTEPPRRFANGFSCLCFALIGAPMAILRRYSDSWATFFVCFLPILVIYYPLMMWGVDRAKTGAMPPMIVWAGNAVLALWGLWLLRRVYRY